MIGLWLADLVLVRLSPWEMAWRDAGGLLVAGVLLLTLGWLGMRR